MSRPRIGRMLSRHDGPVTAGRAMSRLTAFGWHVETKAHLIESYFGRHHTLPSFVAWGHPSHPVNNPVMAIAPRPEDIEEACYEIWKTSPRAVWILGAGLDIATFRSVAQALSEGPISAAIYLADRGTLDRAQAVRLARAPFEPSSTAASAPRHTLGPSPTQTIPPPPPPETYAPEHAPPVKAPRSTRRSRRDEDKGPHLPGLETFPAKHTASVILNHPNFDVPALDIAAIRLACA